jgi:molybdopterin-guanine dinucleotide biosynthesis protein B
MNRKIIGVVGFKKAGKTTLVEKLVKVFTARGLKISTVKHAHHTLAIDHEGRDSFRHRAAGAGEVAVISSGLWAHMRYLDGEAEPSLDEVLANMAPCDLIIIEGYKRDRHLKIEVRDISRRHPTLAAGDPTVIAIAASQPVEEKVPVFSRDDAEALADFIAARLGLKTPR